MDSDNINLNLKNIQNITAFLINIAKIPKTDIQFYFNNNENISSYQNSIFSLQKEFNCVKKLVADIQSQAKNRQFNSVKEKNDEFINLQNKLSELEKVISNNRLEIASLKRSISMQEAQNALLTAENLNLKSNNSQESFIPKKKINDFSMLNSDFGNNLENDLKNERKINSELRNTIKKLKLDLQQAGTANLKSDKTNSSLSIKNNSEINQYNNSDQFTISELQQKLSKAEMSFEKSVEKQSKNNRKIMNLMRDHASQFEFNINSRNNILQNKIGELNRKILEIKAKLIFNDDLKKKNFFLTDQLDLAKQLLDFAMQSMACLAGVSDENVPSAYDVLKNGEMLNIYLSDLQAKVVEKNINEAELSTKPTKKQQLNTTLDTMNDLMSIMTEQMQNEHEMLMSQISDDKELPSFRKTIMYQNNHA